MRDRFSCLLVSSLATAVAVAGLGLGGCSNKAQPAPAASASVSPVVAAAAPEPAPSASAAEPPATPKPPEEILGAPRKVVEGDGITITEQSDGRVRLKTTSLWNDPIEVLYQGCDFYRDAIPVLTRQVRPERAKLLTRICVGKGGVAAPKAPAGKAP